MAEAGSSLPFAGTFDLHAAAVEFDQLLGDGQP